VNVTTQHEILADAPTIAKPEWLRIDAAVKLFGISRSTLYKLIGERRKGRPFLSVVLKPWRSETK
jgi:hypothetical protein